MPVAAVVPRLLLDAVTVTWLVAHPTAPASGRSGRQAPLVRLPFPHDDGSLTPYSFRLGYPLMTLVYDTLLWRDLDGVAQPWLAGAVEQSADGRAITVRLAEGAKWHDGKPVTADDVAFTFGFVMDHPHPRFTPQLRAVERVEASDPSTAVIALRHPSPGFFDQPLADLPILPAHLWRGLPADRSAPEGLPVGSGPYRLVDYRPGRSYRFEANPSYFRGAPAVAAIEVPVIDDLETTLQALERRRVDMLPLSLPGETAQRFEGLGTRVVKGPSYVGTALVLNTRRAPLDRVEARRAVARALDLDRIARVAGDATPALRGYVHPASPWSSPRVLHEFDQRAAREALAGAGVTFLDVMAPANDPGNLEAGRQVALALRRAGVEAGVRPVAPAQLARALGEDGSAPSVQAAILGTSPLASYEPDFLRTVFGSGLEEAPWNHAGYQSAGFDALAERIATTTDPLARRAAVAEALRLLAHDAPVVPLFFAAGTYAYRPVVYDGWVFVKGSGLLDKRSFVEPAVAPRPTGSPPVEPPESGGSPLGWAGLGLVAMALTLAVFTLVRGRR